MTTAAQLQAMTMPELLQTILVYIAETEALLELEFNAPYPQHLVDEITKRMGEIK